MADKNIGALPAATTVDDDSLWVAENQGEAQKVTGAQIKGFAQAAVEPYVDQAQAAAAEAAASASEAAESVTQTGMAVEDTQANAQAAQAAQTAAETAQGLAEDAQKAAEAAADGVESYATAAEQAKDAAIAAQQAAETAEWNAETSATGAATSASQASQSASDASGSATDAAGSATTATQAASDAQAAQLLAETAKTGAEAAEDGAEAARAAILNMIVKAITLETGQPATVSKELVNGIFQLTFGLPKGNTGKTGAQGIQGVSIESIQLTSGNHAPGTTDTYTITMTNGSTATFSVYNGANGTGAGDFMASGVVPMTGDLQMGGNRVVGVGEPQADDDAVRRMDLTAGAEKVQNALDAHIADKQNPHEVTAQQVGGIPAAQKGAAGGVASLGSDGKVPAGQLPDMDYDPAGTAASTVNAHNANATAHQNLKISFTEAPQRANIYDGLSLAACLGKIKKWFADMKSAAFCESADFAGATHAAQHASGGSDPITPASIGAAAASHKHAAGDTTSGTFAAARLPTVPINKGGTNATTAAAARANLGTMGIVAIYGVAVKFSSGKVTYSHSAIKPTSVCIVQRRSGTAGSATTSMFGTTSGDGYVTIVTDNTTATDMNLNIIIINP